MSRSSRALAVSGPSRWSPSPARPSRCTPLPGRTLHKSPSVWDVEGPRSFSASTRLGRPGLGEEARSQTATGEGRGGGGRGLLRAALVGLLGGGTYMLGSLYPPSYISLLYPTPAPPRLDKDSDAGIAHCAEIERQLLALPAVQELKASASPASRALLDPHSDQQSIPSSSSAAGSNPVTEPPLQSANPKSTAHYLMSRPYARFPASKALHSLTAGSLRGPGLFATAPLVMSLTPHGARALGGYEGDAYAFIHLGRSMCGHDGLIHGGLLATVLDETLARTAFFNLPHHVGVTARLEVDYRAPVKADQFVVVRTEKVESKGRKCVVQGSIQSLDGQLLVQAKAIFVEPRMAKYLDTSLVKQAMDADGEAAKAPLISPAVKP